MPLNPDFAAHLFIALFVSIVPLAQGDDGPPSGAWPALEWKKGAPTPFVRVESPAAVVGGKLYLFGGFTGDLGASKSF